MFFFQVLLLVGYCYAHWSTRFLSLKMQMWLHLALILAGLVLLPIRIPESLKPTGSDPNPVGTILWLLWRSVGIQFLLLATTAPLVQVWWHRLFGSAPYRLYSISNAGSLLALLGYPFLVEPLMGVRTQMTVWSVGFFAVSCMLALASRNSSEGELARGEPEDTSTAARPVWRDIAGWLALSTCGSVLLLAMTNHITQNVAVIPFFWVVPLAIYLLSFILSFAGAGWYNRWVYGGLMFASHSGVAFIYCFDVADNIILLLTIYLTALFSGCMVCHGELARAKPHARYLTSFFVVTSVGGALGGFLVSLVAPIVFSAGYLEYPLVLVACWLALIVITLRDKSSPLYRGRPVWAWGLISLCCFGFLLCLREAVVKDLFNAALTRRNFYGVLSVQPMLSKDQERMVQLIHGQISHGSQFLIEEGDDPAKQFEPTTYYTRDSGVGLVMKEFAKLNRPKRVGMLGMGVGTVAAYCEQGDVFRAYEINEDVVEIATNGDPFTFWDLLKERGATGDIVIGDARLSLEAELSEGTPQNFDVLVLDVFSGDAIPVHLMTLSAFKLYFEHLAEGGVLAVHISNRHLDLAPVVVSTAARFPVKSAFVSTKVSEWILVGSEEFLQSMAEANPGEVQILGRSKYDVVWTDDYSDIFRILK